MNILTIFICIFTNAVLSHDDATEILSISVDGLLMNEASLTASATCGMNGPEKYCRLVDEGNMMTETGLESNVMCDICDDRNETKRHPIEFAKSDDKDLWWQSPSMAQGAEYQRVNITIDLKQVYQIVYILLKMADSPRPGTWVLEKSTDGRTFEAWIFFADTPYDCYNHFQRKHPNIKMTTHSKPRDLGDDEVFCTTYYSQTKSLIAGEIIISLINGRKSLMQQDDLAPRSIPLKLINFLSARFIRFRFLKPLTLAADLMTHKGHLEKSIYNRYYYSLRNIEVGGKCICNNHADMCEKVVRDGITMAKCNCKHFTCGNNCETCCPLFNQKQWRQSSPCEECNCNGKARHCIYNQTVANLQLSFNKFGYLDGGGVCVDCREDTTGINCEKCKLGFYRPWNVRATESFPCKPCSCHGPGTVGACISNGEEADNQKPGDCICKKGYKGRMCDQCELGYERHQNGDCQPCPCSIDGSVSNSLYRCQPPCNCKVNVDTKSNCHRCRENFFNLQGTNDEGCQACYCFGITDRCSSLSAQNLRVQTLYNWKVTTLTRDKVTDPKMSSLQYPILENTIIDVSLGSPSIYYLSAPGNYLGNWLSSYKSVLQYVVKIDKEASITGSQIDSADVIIRCGSGQLLSSSSSDDARQQRMVNIPLNMKYWKYLPPGGLVRSPSQDDFMACLVNVTSLLIKAKYYSNQLSIGLLNVTLERGDTKSAIDKMPNIEKCECPPTFAGLSCEGCEAGHRRVNNLLVNGRCELCNCFQHSNSCDAFSGACKDCAHNTAGKYCDSCSPGFYGNPRTGPTNACKRCSCPLVDYQLTNMCSTFKPSKYICHECSENSSGYHCQRCTEGYYGNPMKKIPCTKCQCNDNEERCDSITGQCTCSYNTMGSSCDTCLHGFYGDASTRGCKNCNCAIFGSDSQFCNKTSGLCSCKPDFSGRTCDSCVEGLYLKDEKCVPCFCDRLGRIPSKQFCNSTTGKCLCRKGVTGDFCDRCLPDHYGFPDCKECGCSNHAMSMNCDPIDGSCKCGSNVADQKCDQCLNSFFWSTRTDCSPCNCGRGSSQALCDMNSGQCPCAEHVIGRTCEQCQFNYYGVSPSGCQKCPVCSRGRVCSNDGECVCPLNTEGEYCQLCTDQSWGYNSTTGCKTCDCFKFGSLSQTCNAQTGQCLCNSQFQGKKCNKCAPELFGFPNCQACNCNNNGVLLDRLNTCDSVTGHCPCKENVEGNKCGKCKNGTFGLDGSYSAGCYSCYCSGRSSQCSNVKDHRILSNGLFKYHMYNDLQQFVSGKDQGVIVLSFLTLPKFGWPFQYFRPVFIDVTSRLSISDMSMMYGSVVLIANIECQDTKCGRESSKQTEAVLESYGGEMELRYVVTHSNVPDGRIVLELSETSKHGQWSLTKYANKSMPVPTNLGHKDLTSVARDIFMLALLNVSKVKIQLYTSSLNPDEVKLNLETFSTVQTTDNVGKAVVAVEKCECDSTTFGLHCENAIHGYYKKPVSFPQFLFNVSVRLAVRIKVDVVKCSCNGHSNACNRDTGYCDICKDNTAGSKCHLCAEGFYGDPRNGGQCLQCECPSNDHNYAKTCSEPSSSTVTDCECQKGYTGKLCQKCQEGFFGIPSIGRECKSCNCNSEGSLSDKCDDSGQCICAAGVTGRKCDQCTANSAVENKKCKNCLTGCTRELFLKVNKLNDSVVNFKWRSLPSKAEAVLHEISLFVSSVKKNITKINRLVFLSEEIEKSVAKFQDKRKDLLKKFNDAVLVKNAYNATLRKIYEIFKDINETIDGGGKTSETSIGVINNATDILREMKNLMLQMPNLGTVERELSIVPIHIDKINRMKKSMGSSMHNGQFVNIKDLVGKTKLANVINIGNRKYLDKLNVTILKYEKIMKYFQTKLIDKDKEYDNILSRKAILDVEVDKLKRLLSEFEFKITMTSHLVLNIRELLKKLATETPTRNVFIIPESVKEIVKKIVEQAELLIKNLLQSFQVLNRAEDAKHAYSNITKNIKEVEEAINSSRKQLEDSRNQLSIDKASNNIKHITTENQGTKASKSDKENVYHELNLEYDAQRRKEKVAWLINIYGMSKISKRKMQVVTISENMSNLNNTRDNNQKKIDELKKELSILTIPTIGYLNVTDIKKEVDNLKILYGNVTKDTNSVIVTVKEIRESLRKIRERLSKRSIYAELAHGAAAKSPEPIRLDRDCVRHYKTYFLPRSNAFSFELYLNPQFTSEQSLVFLGFDNSEGTDLSYALTIEKNNQIKFWYDFGVGLNELKVDGSIFVQGKYVGLSISWLLDKWEIRYKSLEEKDSKLGVYSVNKTGVNNIFIGPKSHIFLGGFPSDRLLKKSGLNLGGRLIQYLGENYKTKHYKGCLYGAKIMNVDLGLQDFHSVEDECIKTSSADFVLKKDFNCKINTAFVESFKSVIRRQKRDINTDYNIHFNGHGYVMINTSQAGQQTVPCLNILKKAITIFTFPQSKINAQSFQFVAVFANEKLNIGFVLGQKNGIFQRAFWKGTQEETVQGINGSINNNIVWKTFDENNDLIFGKNELCDRDSYMYLGGIPLSETRLREKLARLNVPYNGYTGSMKIVVVDKEVFRKSGTRFVNKNLRNEKQISNFPFHSLLMSAGVAEPILLDHGRYRDVLERGFSVNLDFMGIPVLETLTLLYIKSERTNISLSVSPDGEFTVFLNSETISVKDSNNKNRWGNYFVVVTLILKSEMTEIYVMVNEPRITMKEFPIRTDTKVTKIEIGQPNMQRTFYIYDIFLGKRLVNFNDLAKANLPLNAYLKLSQSQLSPKKSSLDYSSKVAKTDFRSENYPMDSAWFEGGLGNMVSLNSAVINTYVKEGVNKVTIRLVSHSTIPELILTINFGEFKTLSVMTMNGQAMLHHSNSLTTWISILRVPIIDTEWHLLELGPSSGSGGGLLVKIDGHTFDFPNGPLSFTKPSLIEIGGYTSSSFPINYDGRLHDVKKFTGCLDNLTINGQKVSLNVGSLGTSIKQCPRVLEFLPTGVEILSSYSSVSAAEDMVKLTLGDYTQTEAGLSLLIEFRFKYTGFEKGGLFVTGDGSRFCAVVILDNKINLNCNNFATDKVMSVAIDLTVNKWYKVVFHIFHKTQFLSLFKILLEDKDVQILFMEQSEVFSSEFSSPQIYLGGHPKLSRAQKNTLMKTDLNFVGCISGLKAQDTKIAINMSIGQSRFIEPGRCSVDTISYLRAL